MDVMQRIFLCGLVPVIKVGEATDAVPLCRALLAGGIDVAEITFRSAAAAEAISLVSDQLPEMLTGAAVAVAPSGAHAAALALADHVVAPTSEGGWSEIVDLL